MKRLITLLIPVVIFLSCKTSPPFPDRDFRSDMRNFVIKISDYARDPSHTGGNPDFIVIPQNGQEIITWDGEPDGLLVDSYIDAIDGTGREDVSYGYTADNVLTPETERDYFISYLDPLEGEGIEALVTDYCSTHQYMDNSYSWNSGKGYISFAAPERGLNVIPDYPDYPYPHANDSDSNYDVDNLSAAKNFLYLINGEKYSKRQDFIDAVKATNYDVIIMDLFHDEDGTETEFTPAQISELKMKPAGGSRLVIAYMSIGEAEDYRYYWKSSWSSSPPFWLGKENPDWEGNFKVWYWEDEWQDIIVGGEDSYLQKIMDAGFDGVYLDIIDAFEYFENY